MLYTYETQETQGLDLGQSRGGRVVWVYEQDICEDRVQTHHIESLPQEGGESVDNAVE